MALLYHLLVLFTVSSKGCAFTPVVRVSSNSDQLRFSPVMASTPSHNPLNEAEQLKQQKEQQSLNKSSLSSSLSSSSPSLSKQPKAAVRWGIVGLGDVCKKKAGPAFLKCAGSELVAVMQRTPGKAQAWAQENVHGDQCKGYDNLDDFLNHPGLDAVYIATPPGSHLEVARHVANHNNVNAGRNSSCLAVYVEKPVGRCAWETEAIVKLFDEKQCGSSLFYPAYISRAYERTQAIKKLLQEGVVGEKVTSVKYTLRGTGGARGIDNSKQLPWRMDAAQSGGGLIMDVGCHVIDRIDYLFGPLVHVKGTSSNRNSPNQNVEDFVEFQAEIGESTSSSLTNNTIAYKDITATAIDSVGAKVKCVWDFSASDSHDACDEFLISGPAGSLRMAAMGATLPIEVLDSKGDVLREVSSFQELEHAAQPLIQLITNDIRNAPPSSQSEAFTQSCPARADNAIRTSKVLDVVLGDYYGGRQDEFWLRPESWPK